MENKAINTLDLIGKYSNLNDAKLLADKHNGSEVIVKNEKGEFEVFTADPNKEKTISALKSTKNGSAVQIIEFTSDTATAKTTFSDYNSAKAAAYKSNGIEAIIKNPDNTFSLKTISQKDVEMILGNKGKYPEYYSIISPYQIHGKNVEGKNELTNMELIINSSNVNGKLYDFGMYKTAIERSADNTKFGWAINQLAQSSTENSVEYSNVNNDAKNLDQKVISLLDNSKDILGSLSRNEVMRPDMVTRLSGDLNSILTMVANHQVDLDASSVDKIKGLLNNLNKLKEVDVQLAQERANFNNIRTNLSVEMTKLNNQINKMEKSSLSTDEKTMLGFLKHQILDKYLNQIMNSNDPGQIALYNAFLTKVMNMIDSNQMTGKLLASMMSDFSSTSEILAKHANHQEITVEDRVKVDKYLQNMSANNDEVKTINNYLGVPPEFEVSSVNTDPLKPHSFSPLAPFAPTLNNDTTGTATNKTPAPVVPVGGFGFSTSDIKAASELKDSGFAVFKKPIINDDGTQTTLIGMMKEGIGKNISSSSHSLAVSTGLVKTSFTIQQEMKVAAPEIINVMDKLREISQEHIKKQLEDDIKVQIKKIIEMEADIDGLISPDKASIVPLLEKFRDIIVEFDHKTREHLAKEIIDKMIEDSFTLYLKENKGKLKNIDEARDLLIDSFKSSSEVKDASLPLDIKQLKASDELMKIALVALNF